MARGLGVAAAVLLLFALEAGAHDLLTAARCAASCWHAGSAPGDEACVRACVARPATKPGHCPEGNLTVFDAVCLDACQEDVACPGTLKCCAHRCGATCQEAYGLHNVPGLPGVPTEVTVTGARRGRHVTIYWAALGEKGVLYLLQQRHHVGREYSEQRLGPWMPVNTNASPHTSLRRLLRPGRWYLFRVAAVGANGTRGYSKPSDPFMLAREPSPPAKPTNLTVTWVRVADGSHVGMLTWRAPQSDLPIHHYRVYWSRLLPGATSTPTSVLQDKQCVPRHSTKVHLRNLLPNSQYFLQVQALAQFGLERLKGELEGTVLNTTDSSQPR